MQAQSVGYGIASVISREVAYRKPFTYVANFPGTIAGAGTVAQSLVQLHSDSDFELTKITWCGYDNAAPTSDSLIRSRIRLQVTDGASMAEFFSDFAYVAHVAGEAFTACAPVFSLPRYLRGSSTLTVRVRNDMPTTTLTGVRIAFMGNKLFRS